MLDQLELLPGFANGAEEGLSSPRRIADYFRIPDRYLRSVHLERDFDDPGAMRHYVMTAPMGRVFSRVAEGLRAGSGHRAWRITGDYGTGKSSFALVLAHLLREPDGPELNHVRGFVGVDLLAADWPRLIPVLVTGAREPIVPAVARGLSRALRRLPARRAAGRAVQGLEREAAVIAESRSPEGLLSLIDRTGDRLAQRNEGLLLVLDELGKFLEYAALHPEDEDVYLLQQLAERASGSDDHPLILVGLLHQGFHAYAERLPSTARAEWEKVAGRFEEIAFDQPLVHVARLSAGALNLDLRALPSEVITGAEPVEESCLETGWFGVELAEWSPVSTYPLHPMVLPVAVSFFARFGQHERSLFSFLLSNEPFGLQQFAQQPISGATWYRLSDFYDYVRAVFGHRLSGASHQNQWLRLVGTLDRLAASAVDPIELRVLKTVALLNLLDAEQLLPTAEVLKVAVADADPDESVDKALAELKGRGLLFDRGSAGGYCLWPQTSVNLDAAFRLAQRTLGPSGGMAAQLKPYLDDAPIVARRHYIQTGTLRYFELRYALTSSLLEVATKPTAADGVVVVALCETDSERAEAASLASSGEIASHPNVVIAIPPSLRGVELELEDCRCWQWVAENTPELLQDSYAAAEVARQIANARHSLARKLGTHFGVRGASKDVEWWSVGQRFELPLRGGLASAISTISTDLFAEAPLIRNELVNRRVLSSAATAARFRLIERMFAAEDQPLLGLDPNQAPPEKSMYLSVLQAGNVHRRISGRYAVAIPPPKSDPLRLRPSLTTISKLLANGAYHRVPTNEILDVLGRRPFGVRPGVAILLVAIAAIVHRHELAVYERGTFLPRFTASDFLRLIKTPSSFEFQLCRVTGVRAEVFGELVRTFLEDRDDVRQPQIIDVVRKLSMFAAGLDEYTRRSSHLEELSRAVRDALLSAREPGTLLFRDLPVACGVEPFDERQRADEERARVYANTLRSAMEDLRTNYPRLLDRIRGRLAEHLVGDVSRLVRTDLARRASLVALAAREPRLQGFARAIADLGLPDDRWSERLGSYVIAKPPLRWTTADEASADDAIDTLAGAFLRLEATAFTRGSWEPDITAVRVAVTPYDGRESARVVRIRPEDEPAVGALAQRVEEILREAGVRDLQLAVLARVLNSRIANYSDSEGIGHAASMAINSGPNSKISVEGVGLAE